MKPSTVAAFAYGALLAIAGVRVIDDPVKFFACLFLLLAPWMWLEIRGRI